MKPLLLLCGLLVIAGCHAPHKQPARSVSIDNGPVHVSFKTDPQKVRAGETIDVLLVFEIAATYEIQDRHARPPAVATRVDVGLPAGFEAISEWSEPTTVRSQWPDGHPVYIGRATFSRKVRVGRDVKPGQYPLSCRVFYQACNDRYCLPPAKEQIISSFTVASPAVSRR
jgi:hypothetical protein